MAHQVEQMFSVKETPWHGLGHIVHEAPDAETAIRLAGLNWGVRASPIFRDENGNMTLVQSHKLLYRDDSNKQLGIVGKDYEPLQNSDAFGFFNPFIDSKLATFETAGCLREGKTVWVLAKLNRDPINVGKGDLVNKFLLLSNGHDGSMAVRVGFTPIRVVCANTLAMSHEAGASKLLRVFHSKQVVARLDKIQEIVNAADAKFEATAEQYRELARHDVDQKALKKYVEIVFGFSAVEDAKREAAKQKTINNIVRLFETGRGQDLQGAKGTFWGLYNATTEFLSWERGRSEDTRLNSLWFGDSSIVNKRALKVAIEAVAA